MQGKFYDTVTSLLRRQQLSISSLSRELKKSGYEQHRLILTGYLRALRDLGEVNEVDIPPSKVYQSRSGRNRDIYASLRESLDGVDDTVRFAVCVYILNQLLNRPCFRQEVLLTGTEVAKTKFVRESRDGKLNEHRSAITRMEIPQSDPAYEATAIDVNLANTAVPVIARMLRERLDLEGIKAKHEQTRLHF
ncbi:MAG TPA: hypothetical protein HA257_00340 [Candidatus Methanoperedenaceae archaeon]|nr:hypothetical protein [Candidatus Methanoperedenaceae archaeon]